MFQHLSDIAVGLLGAPMPDTCLDCGRGYADDDEPDWAGDGERCPVCFEAHESMVRSYTEEGN